jgi:hypothetical protein
MTTKKAVLPLTDKEVQIIESWRLLFKWLFILGALTSGVTYALSPDTGTYQPDAVVWTLMVIGIFVGIFYFDSDDFVNIGLRYLIFGTVVGAVENLYFVGIHITNFMLGVRLYLGPIVLTVAVMYFVKKYILNK